MAEQEGGEPWSLNDHTELSWPPTSQSTSLGPHLYIKSSLKAEAEASDPSDSADEDYGAITI